MINKKLFFKIRLSPKDKIKGVKIPTALNLDLAYLCGIFAGDGSIYTREEKHDYILKCVGNPKDEKSLYLHVIGPCFKKIFGFMPNIHYQDSGTTFGFVIYSKALFEFLTNVIGLPSGRKYDTLRIPPIFEKEERFTLEFIRGVIDTDGSISFKRKYKENPYYPVITLSSKSRVFISDIANKLKSMDFRIAEMYDYKVVDRRVEKGYTVINTLNLNGRDNLKKWMNTIGFKSPKHLEKINKFWEEK